MPSREPKRHSPSNEARASRSVRLAAMRELNPEAAIVPRYTLEPGNKKIGYSSVYYEAVYVWNLPPVVTCPGRSDWCSSLCYNGDDRPDVYKRDVWRDNWWGVLHEPEIVRAMILSTLGKHRGKTALRIHSSGDFFSEDYIDLWRSIAHAAENTEMWAYTRSWTDPKLMKCLETLRMCDNVELFASWDDTMQEPPAEWRRSFVDMQIADRKMFALNCPEQYEKKKNVTCASCRYCITKRVGDINFALH